MQKRDSPEPMHNSDPTPDASRVVRPRVLTPTERDTLVTSLHELAKNYLRDTTDTTTIAHDLMHLYGMAKVDIQSTDKVFYADSGRQEHTVNALQMLDMWTVFRPIDAAGPPAPGLAIYTQNKTSDVDPRVQRMDITKLNPEQCTVRLDMLQYCLNGVWHSLFSDAVYAAMAREMMLAFAASPAGRTVVTSPEIFDAKVVVMAKKVEEAMQKHRGASCPAYFNQTVTVGNKGQDHAVTLRILNRKPTAGPHAGFDVIATALPNLDTSFEVREVRSFKEVGLNRLVPSDSAGAGVKRMAHSLLAQNTETAYEARAMAEQVRAQRTGSARAPHLQQGRTIFGGELETTGFFATATVMTFGLKAAPMAGGGQAKGATRSVRSVLHGRTRGVRGGGNNDDTDVDEVELSSTGVYPRLVATNVVPGPEIGEIDSEIAMDPTLPSVVVELDGVSIKGIMNAALEVDGADPLHPMPQDKFNEHMGDVLNLARGWKKALLTQIERYNCAHGISGGAAAQFCGVQQAGAGVLLREADMTARERAMIEANRSMQVTDALHAMDAMQVDDDAGAGAAATEEARVAEGMREWAKELVVAQERSLCVCPISQELMRDPVLVGEQVYDRHYIEEWLAACRRGHRPPTCPLTRQVFSSDNVVGVRMLKAQAEKDVGAMLAELQASGEALPAGFLPPLAPPPPPSSVHREHDLRRMRKAYEGSPMMDASWGHCDMPLGQNATPITFMMRVCEYDGKDDEEGEKILPVSIGATDEQGVALPDEASAWTANAIDPQEQVPRAAYNVRRTMFRSRRRTQPRKETMYMFQSTDACKVFGFKPTPGMLVRVTIANGGGQDIRAVPTYLGADGAVEPEETIHLTPQEEAELPYPLQKDVGEGADAWVLKFSDDNGSQCGVALVFGE